MVFNNLSNDGCSSNLNTADEVTEENVGFFRNMLSLSSIKLFE